MTSFLLKNLKDTQNFWEDQEKDTQNFWEDQEKDTQNFLVDQEKDILNFLVDLAKDTDQLLHQAYFLLKNCLNFLVDLEKDQNGILMSTLHLTTTIQEVLSSWVVLDVDCITITLLFLIFK